MQEPHSSYHIKENYINSKNLVDVFFNRGLKNFIFVGTINEYGSQNGAVTEKYKSKKKLRNYEKGKIKFANYGKKLSKKISKNFIHIRLSNLYGPLQKKNSLIHSIHKAYNEGKNLRAEIKKTNIRWVMVEKESLLIERDSQKPKGKGSALPKTDTTDIEEHIVKLSELKDKGVLTEEEFQTKKKELLDRI